MGYGVIRCFLGFSVTFSNDFSEALERRADALDRHFRRAHGKLLEGFCILHDAVDSALADDPERTTRALDRGLAELQDVNDHLTAIGDALVRTRSELFEREGRDASDPIIARERCFPGLDFEGAYRLLSAHGGALPQRVFWDDVATRMRDGGARAGLRLLDRHLRELQSDLRTFQAEVESTRSLPLAELPPVLHGMSLGVSALLMGFVRLLTVCNYFSFLCERATEAYESSRSGADRIAQAG